MSRNRNQHQRNHQNNQRHIGFNAEPERNPMIVPEGLAPQIIIPLKREEYMDLLSRSITLDLIANIIDKKDSYMDVRPIQKLLGLLDCKKEDAE